MDVANAFIQGDFDEEILMTLPLVITLEINIMCRLLKSLYGLKHGTINLQGSCRLPVTHSHNMIILSL